MSTGRTYRDQNLSGADSVDEEALGAAVYLEEISSGERRDYTLEDLSEYIAGTDNFNFQDFIDYKADMANDYSVFSDELGDFFDDVQALQDRTEANSAMYQALYEEVKNERDSALRALMEIGGRAGDFDLDQPGMDNVDTTPDFDVGVPDIPDVGLRDPDSEDTDDTDDTGNGTAGAGGGMPGWTQTQGWGGQQAQWGAGPFGGAPFMAGMPGMWQMQMATFGGPFDYDPEFWSEENIYGGDFDLEDGEGDAENEDDGEEDTGNGMNYQHEFFQPENADGPFMYQSMGWG